MRGPPVTALADSAVTLRRAGEADLPACARVVNDYLDATAWLPRLKSRDEIAALFGPQVLAVRRILVAEEAGRVVGYISLNGSHIAALYLDPGARGRGVGRALLAAAKARSPGGLTLTVFEPNARARAFYVREGFVEVPDKRDDATEEGVPTLWLHWPGETE